MTLVIDTYNVLHVEGVLPPELTGLDVHDLAALIAASRYRHRQARLVCDGVRVDRETAIGLPRSVRVEYAGTAREADDLIREIVSRSSSPKRLLVVSSDRAVRNAARKRRSAVLDSPTFLRQLATDAVRRMRQNDPPRPIGPLTPEHIEHWISYFNLTEQELSIPGARQTTQTPVRDEPSEAPAGQRSSKRRGKLHTKSTLDSDEPLPPEVIEEADRLLRPTKETNED